MKTEEISLGIQLKISQVATANIKFEQKNISFFFLLPLNVSKPNQN